MTIDRATGTKRPYATPKLVAYGDVASLTKTLAGSVVEVTEGAAIMNMKRP